MEWKFISPDFEPDFNGPKGPRYYIKVVEVEGKGD